MKIATKWGLRAALLLLWWSIPLPKLSGQDTTAEAALKVQLAQAQATINTLTKAQALEAHQRVVDTAEATRQRQVQADEAAQQRAKDAAAAKDADQTAVRNAAVSKTQANQLLKVEDQSKYAGYTTVFTSVLALLTLLVKAVIDAQNHRWSVEAITAQSALIAAQHATLLTKIDAVSNPAPVNPGQPVKVKRS